MSKITLHKSRQLYSLHKSTGIYIKIAKDVETRFDIWNYELDRALAKEKNEKVIGLTKDDLGKN